MKETQLLTKQLKGHLLSYFQELMQSQRALQTMKRDICKMKGFSCRAIFNKIANHQLLIDIQSFRTYLQHKLACNQRELYSIFYRFDHLQQGTIHYQDFNSQLTINNALTNVKKRRSKDQSQLTYEVESAFIKMLVLHIKTVRVLDVWRKQLASSPSYVIFKYLDRHATGKIGPSDLHFFFIAHKEQLNRERSLFLFHIIRKNYKEINLQAFCQNINPLQLGYYKGYDYEFTKLKQSQVLQKQNKYREAKQQEMNYLKQRNKDVIIGEVHKEAALIRQKELQERIADEIRLYNQIKYQTKLKFRPNLTYEAFLLSQKQNIADNQANIGRIQQQRIRKEADYKRNMIKVQALRHVQLFKLSKGNQSHQYTQRISRNASNVYDQQNSTREIQDRIRVYRQDKLIDENRNGLSWRNGAILRGNTLQLT